MSRTLIHLFSEYDGLSFECQDDEPTVWIRAESGPCISLGLTKADRAKLRAALDEADKSEDALWPFADNTGMP